MPLLEPAPGRTLDPLQSVLAHMPNGMYGSYEALCQFMWIDPLVPSEVKEALRFLSACRIGCAFCQTVRETDRGGNQLLPDSFYTSLQYGEKAWEDHVDAQWHGLFVMAEQVLRDERISDATMDAYRDIYSPAQIVEALFFMLVVGASHRFSVAFGLEDSCPVPTQIGTT